MTDTNPTTTPPAATTTEVPSSMPQPLLPDQTTTTTTTPPLASNPFGDEGAATAPATAAQPSLSPPAATTPVAPTPDPVERTREGPVDPRVVALRAMFPDYDDLILQSVLESVGGDQDRAIDALLGMSDPDYRSEAPPPQPVQSQNDLDEQLARHLMIEEQEEQARAAQAWEAQNQNQRPGYRPQSNQQQPQSAGATGGSDTMGEFQQQFSKIAESGKKTFGTIFSKVKAKIQELDQPKQGQGSNAGTSPNWGGGYDPNLPQQSGQQQPSYGQYPARQQSSQTPQQQPAYYDPNAGASPYVSASPSPPIALSPPRANPPPGAQGYDATPDPHPTQHSSPPPVVAPKPTTAAATTPPTGEVPRPPQTGSGNPIDGGKLGLLPKRPVSLLRSQSPPGAAGSQGQPHQLQRSASEDDSDGLEYAENPFEETKK